MSVILGLVGIENNQILFQIFAGIGILNSTGSIRYIFKKNIKQMEWILEHMGNIIGCGIACYTAFFAFGGRRFMQEILTGNLQLIPWILPAAIGITASVFLTKKYTQQFKIA